MSSSSAPNRSFQLITLCISLQLSLFLLSLTFHPLHYPHRFQLAGELIITYHSWRTYPKSKHLTLLIRLMPWGARALAPAACAVPPPPALASAPAPALCWTCGCRVCSVFSKLKRKSFAAARPQHKKQNETFLKRERWKGGIGKYKEG